MTDGGASNDRERRQENRRFVSEARKAFAQFGIRSIDSGPLPGETATSELRRRRRRRLEDRVGVMTLFDVDGVLRWEIGAGTAPGRRRSRRAAGPPRPRGEIVDQFKFEDLPPNLVGQKLQQLDDHLTPQQGLFRLTSRTLADLNGQNRRGGRQRPVMKFDQPARSSVGRRVLLFVHGTFSNCEHLLQEFAATPEGRALLAELITGGKYDEVLAFNHPTVSVSPVLNATRLAQSFRGSPAEVDVICHSRGGLVTRWWLEILDHYAADSGAEEPARGRVIFAGSPLAGTGLAAPHRLKAAIDVLTNISRALEWTARGAGVIVPAAAPLAHAAGVLFSMFGKLTALAARTPILDAGISMLPGLNAQSRVGTNREIAELRDAIGRRSGRPAGRFLADYYFLTSNFETDSPGWKFWKYFRKDKLADIATDMVFDGANDLVVDTPSMTSLADECEPVAGHVLDYGTNNVVHHCNYFQQPASIEFIRKTLLE